MRQEVAPSWSAGEREAVWSAARSNARDRYLAALLAPRGRRDDLVALAAFVGDITRIALTVREPALAEIRWQWWLDRLDADAPHQRSGNPVADCLLEMITRRGLDRANFCTIVEHTRLLVAPDGIANQHSAFLNGTDGVVTRLAAELLGVPVVEWQQGLEAAAHAYGLVRLLIDLPVYQAIGRQPVLASSEGASAQDWHRKIRDKHAQARGALANAPRTVLLAALPAALTEPYLRVLEERSRAGRPYAGDISPLRRVWTLWLAYRRGVV